MLFNILIVVDLNMNFLQDLLKLYSTQISNKE